MTNDVKGGLVTASVFTLLVFPIVYRKAMGH